MGVGGGYGRIQSLRRRRPQEQEAQGPVTEAGRVHWGNHDCEGLGSCRVWRSWKLSELASARKGGRWLSAELRRGSQP